MTLNDNALVHEQARSILHCDASLTNPFWFCGDVKLRANNKNTITSIFGEPVVLVVKQPPTLPPDS